MLSSFAPGERPLALDNTLPDAPVGAVLPSLQTGLSEEGHPLREAIQARPHICPRRRQEVLQALDQARRLDPAALDLLAMLETSSLNALGRFDEALRRCSEALRSLNRGARSLPLLILNKGDALLALGHAQEALAAYDEALQLETSHRTRQITDDDALYEGTLYPQLVGDVRSLLMGGMGNAWLVLGDGARALEFYDRALALGPNGAIESNRDQALAFLHASPETGRPATTSAPARELAVIPTAGGTPPPLDGIRRGDAILILKHPAQRLVEVVAQFVLIAIAALLMVTGLVGFNLGYWVRSRPGWLLAAFDILLCALYPLSCWFGWESVPGAAALARPFPGWHTALHRARRALACGWVCLLFSTLLLHTLVDGANRFSPSDHLTPTMLFIATILLALHMVAWPVLTLWAKLRRARPFPATSQRGTARANERGEDASRP